MKAQKGTGLVIVAFVVALVLVIAALFLSAKKTMAPVVPSVPTSTQATSDLNQASSDLNTTDVDTSMDADLNRINTDSSSF